MSRTMYLVLERWQVNCDCMLSDAKTLLVSLGSLGVVGVVPVFDSKEKAEKFAQGELEVFEVETEDV